MIGEEQQETKGKPQKPVSVGDQVWYYLRCDPVPEWVSAEVIDHTAEGVELDPPIEEGSVHLKIKMDRKRHHSAKNVGFRFDAVEGTAPGQWQNSKPKDADGVFKRKLAEYQMREQVNIERARTKPEDR